MKFFTQSIGALRGGPATGPQFRGGFRSLDGLDWVGHSFAAAPQLSPQGRRGDYRGSQQSIHYVVAASQGRRAPRVTRRPRLLVRLRSTPCGGPQSVRNPPISTTYGEEVPRHREDDRRRCPEAAPSGSSAKCCQKAANGGGLHGGPTAPRGVPVSCGGGSAADPPVPRGVPVPGGGGSAADPLVPRWAHVRSPSSARAP